MVRHAPRRRWHRTTTPGPNASRDLLSGARLERARALAQLPPLRASREHVEAGLRRITGSPWRRAIQALEAELAADPGNDDAQRGLAVLDTASETLDSLVRRRSDDGVDLLLVLLEYEAQITCRPDARARRLDLSFHRLRRLPKQIALLTDVEELDVNGCGLRELPASIGKLCSLARLYLQNNRLTSLPEEVAELPRLDALFLRGNQLPDVLPLPRSLGRLVRTFPPGLEWRLPASSS